MIRDINIIGQSKKEDGIDFCVKYARRCCSCGYEPIDSYIDTGNLKDSLVFWENMKKLAEKSIETLKNNNKLW